MYSTGARSSQAGGSLELTSQACQVELVSFRWLGLVIHKKTEKDRGHLMPTGPLQCVVCVCSILDHQSVSDPYGTVEIGLN